MYVIFPADEVVYLSYGRLIYVPQSASADTQVNPPTRTTAATSVEENPQTSNVLLLHETASLKPVVPNQTISLDRKKTKNKVDSTQIQPVSPRTNIKTFRGQTPEVGISKKFTKRGSDSNKSISPPSTSSGVAESEHKGTNIRPRSVSESVHVEHSNKPPILGGSLKGQKSIKDRNTKNTNKSKSLKPEDLNLSVASCSDNKITKERNEIPRSEIINSRSDQVLGVKSDKVRIKRENSFIRRLFNGQLSSSKTLVNEKPAFDFDSLFKREKNSEKLSVSAPATPARFTETGRDSSGIQSNFQRQSGDNFEFQLTSVIITMNNAIINNFAWCVFMYR